MVIGEAQAVESHEPASPSASGRTPEHEVGDEMLSGVVSTAHLDHSLSGRRTRAEVYTGVALTDFAPARHHKPNS